MGRVKRIWYLSPMGAVKVQASLRIRAVSPEPSLLAHTSSESRGTFRQKARSLAPLNGLACTVKICHDGMLKDTNLHDGAHMVHVVHYGLESCCCHDASKFHTDYVACEWSGSLNPEIFYFPSTYFIGFTWNEWIFQGHKFHIIQSNTMSWNS